MAQGEVFEQASYEGNAHQTVVSYAPVGSHGFETREMVEVDAVGVAAGVSRQECRYEYIAAG